MRTVFMVAAPMPAPAVDFEALPAHPTIHGARLVPDDGRVSIDGEEWHFRDIRSIGLDSTRHPWPIAGEISGPHPALAAPARISPDCTFTVGFAPRSVIEDADEQPLVIGRLGAPAAWGRA